VILAEDRRLVREVALKTVAADRPEALRRLRREARVLSTLEHPNIVPLYDVLEGDDGSLQLVLRLLRGRTLHEALAGETTLRGRLGWLPHLLRCAEAVAWAHHRGFIHRDLKPDNLMVGEFGETQVIDWGLALALDEPDEAVSTSEERGPAQVEPISDHDGFTRAGAVLGTPRYMSPEQARGEIATRASDVYALGGMLFELVVGRSPFGAASAAEIIAAHRAVRLPELPRELMAQAPVELVAIATRALAADPGARYPDARAFAADLSAWLAGRRVTAHGYRPMELLRRFVTQFRWPLLLAAVAIAVGLVVFALAFARVATERERAVGAEQATRAALTARDASLATALIGEAKRARSEGERFEAERAATAVLALREDADARGILAELGFGLGLVRIVSMPAPECVQRALAPTPPDAGAVWFCGDHARLSIQRSVADVQAGGPRVADVRVDLPHSAAVFVEGGASLLVQRADNALEWRDVHSGERLVGPVHSSFGHLRGDEEGEAAVVVGYRQITVARRRKIEVISACEGREIQAGAMGVGGWLALCVDGQLATEAGGLRTTDLPGPSADFPMIAAWHGAYFVGSVRGEVRRLEADGARLVTRAQIKLTSSGMVRALRVSPSGEYLIASPERGPPFILDARGLTLVARLPEGEGEAFHFADARTLVTLGDTVSTWRLEPRGVDVVDGLGQVNALASLDRELYIGHGKAVRRVDLATGATRNSDGLSVVKGLAPDPHRPRIFVLRAVDRPAANWLDPDLAPAGHVAVGPGRRAVAGYGGRVVVAVYGSGIWIVEPDGANWQLTPESAWDLTAADGVVAVLTHERRRAALYAVHDGVELLSLEAAGGTAVALTPDLVLIAETGAVFGYARDDAALTRVYAAPRAALIEVQQAGRFVAASARDGEVFIWDDDGALLARAAPSRERIVALHFTPDLASLVTGGWDGRVAVLDLTALTTPRDALAQRLANRWGSAARR